MGIGLTLQQLEGWEGQFDRLVRFLVRAQEAARLNQGEDEMDFTLVVFQQALSLRDWVYATCPEARGPLERFFRESVEMRFCRDLANGFKHMIIGKGRASIDREFSIVFSYNPRGIREGGFVVLGAGYQFEILELARKCVEKWRKFIGANKLLPSSAALKAQPTVQFDGPASREFTS